MSLIFTGGHLHAAEPSSKGLTLVQDGKAVSHIQIAAKATRAARLAAYELQYHVRKITGAELSIITDEAKGEGVGILVGESAATRALNLSAADFKAQEYVIRFQPNAIVLMGSDKADVGEVNYATGAGYPDLFDAQATMYATYDFLERCCDVRWYMPTDLGITYTARKTLTVQSVDVRRKPVMPYRFNDLNVPYPQDMAGDTIIQTPSIPSMARREQNLFYFRNRIGGEPYANNHSFHGYYERFLKTHPDWFAKGYLDCNEPPQLCYSNPELIQQIVQDARDFFDGKGKKPGAFAAGDTFALGPMDNDMWCKCDACRPQVAKEDVRGKGHFARDKSSDYIYTFVNKVARGIQKTHPGKYVTIFAYIDYTYPPLHVKLEPNIKVQLCLLCRNWKNSPTTKKNELAILESWTKRPDCPQLYLWLYYLSPSYFARNNQYRAFPGFFANEIVDQMKLYHASNVRGIFIEPSYIAHGQQSPLLDQLEAYITWKLADQADMDGRKLIEEFFPRYYGPAA
ncbi:MAG: DUF4838 domain-containing protein, partial [Phycisphaeraceae bacterium]|nr:DUF4838 domain-containing protein [Phycisphaeraceae bacterium]